MPTINESRLLQSSGKNFSNDGEISWAGSKMCTEVEISLLWGRKMQTNVQRVERKKAKETALFV